MQLCSTCTSKLWPFLMDFRWLLSSSLVTYQDNPPDPGLRGLQGLVFLGNATLFETLHLGSPLSKRRGWGKETRRNRCTPYSYKSQPLETRHSDSSRHCPSGLWGLYHLTTICYSASILLSCSWNTPVTQREGPLFYAPQLRFSLT